MHVLFDVFYYFIILQDLKMTALKGQQLKFCYFFEQLLHYYHHRSRLEGYLEFYIK